MNPRGDIPQGGINLHRILRRGIPFGPEVTTQENTDVRTQIDRGLLFVSYQAALGGADNPGVPGGFSFLQKCEYSPSPSLPSPRLAMALWGGDEYWTLNKGRQTD